MTRIHHLLHPLIRKFATRISLPVLLIALMASLGVPGAAIALAQSGTTSVIVVNSDGDDSSACTGASTVCLRDAIDTAQRRLSATIIRFKSDETISLNSTLVIQNTSQNPITIDAGTHDIVLDAGNSLQNIEVTPDSELTLQGLGITSGYAYSGGEVYNGGTLTIKNSRLTDGYANYGGGIYNHGTLTLDASTVRNNSAAQGGGIYSDGTLTVLGSTFSDNGGQTGAGLKTEIGTATVSNSTFSGNYGTDGGGINNARGSTLTITNSTLINNSAVRGGAVNNHASGTLFLINSAVFSNTATVGGGLVNDGKATVSNSTLYRNSATLAGGVYNGNVLTMGNSTVYRNSAFGMGGGLFSETNGTVNILSSLIAGNSLTDAAGFNPDVSGLVNSLGYNLIGDPTGAIGFGVNDQMSVVNPGLSGLANNGGLTQTLVLSAKSPAIGQGNCKGDQTISPSVPAVTTDQRGVRRKLSGKGCDVGAYELNKNAPVPSTPTLIPTPTPFPRNFATPSGNPSGNGFNS